MSYVMVRSANHDARDANAQEKEWSSDIQGSRDDWSSPGSASSPPIAEEAFLALQVLSRARSVSMEVLIEDCPSAESGKSFSFVTSGAVSPEEPAASTSQPRGIKHFRSLYRPSTRKREASARSRERLAISDDRLAQRRHSDTQVAGPGRGHGECSHGERTHHHYHHAAPVKDGGKRGGGFLQDIGVDYMRINGHISGELPFSGHSGGAEVGQLENF